MLDIGTLAAGGRSFALDINSNGVVVGESSIADGTSHAFVWDGTTMLDLNESVPVGSGYFLEFAARINDAGQILALGPNSIGFYRTFVLTPSK
jgi:probable HAF family extracellular repeat protein